MKNLLLCLTAVGCAVAPVAAQRAGSAGVYTGPIFEMPSSAPGALRLEAREIDSDGFSVDMWMLTTPDGALITPLTTTTTVGPVPGGIAGALQGRPRPALVLRHTGDDNLAAALYLFKEGEFLPKLYSEELRGYAEGLKKRFGDRLTLLTENDFPTDGAVGSVNGMRPVMVAYDLATSATGGANTPRLRVHDYMVEYGEGWQFVVTVFGRQESVAARRDELVGFLNGLTPFTPPEL